MIKNIVELYLGIGEQGKIFKNNKSTIRNMNLESLFNVMISGMIISGLLYISTLFSCFLKNYKMIYILLFVTSAIIAFLAGTGKKCKKAPDQLLIYMLYISVYLYCIYTGCVLYPHTTSTAICVFMVVLPLFFISEPWKVNLLQFIVLLIFIYASIMSKDFDIAKIDRLNGITFFAIGIFLYYQITKGRIQDIQYRSELEKEKDIDSLTGLLNRRGIEAAIHQYIMKENISSALFLLIDLDNFKMINDTFGHDEGDRILQKAAKIMKKSFRHTDVYGRLGVDEFVIFLPDIAEEKELLESKLEHLMQKLKIQVQKGNALQEVTASIGISCYPQDGS